MAVLRESVLQIILYSLNIKSLYIEKVLEFGWKSTKV